MFNFKKKTQINTNNSTDPFAFDMGTKVEDKITGFTGTITGVARYVTGCDNYLVQPPAKDADYKEGRWLDEGRLQIIEEKVIDKKDVKATRGLGACGEAPIK